MVDFKRRSAASQPRSSAIEYDPNRTARIALLKYSDGEKSYILAPDGLEVGAKVMRGRRRAAESRQRASAERDSARREHSQCIEIMPGRGGQIARSAGQQATLSNREGGYALVKLPSGEIRRIHDSCYATIGQVGNVDHMNVSSGKAGRTRWQGRRPTRARHGHEPDRSPDGWRSGQIEGRRRPPPSDVSPWGQLAKGFKTRAKHKAERSLHPASAEAEKVN